MGNIQVYSRGKYIGIEANDESIIGITSVGFGYSVILTKENFKITQEAYELLFKTQKGDEDDLSEIDCTRTSNGDIVFGWMGEVLALFDSDYLIGGADIDFTLLKDFISNDIVIPEPFIEMCNSLIQEDITEYI